jgi:CheY-like chemotaxis protein
MNEAKPALLSLDLMMPEMDGFQLDAALQQNAEWRDISPLWSSWRAAAQTSLLSLTCAHETLTPSRCTH